MDADVQEEQRLMATRSSCKGQIEFLIQGGRLQYRSGLLRVDSVWLGLGAWPTNYLVKYEVLNDTHIENFGGKGQIQMDDLTDSWQCLAGRGAWPSDDWELHIISLWEPRTY